MRPHLKIDFVSDVSCPWCVIGLLGLLQAINNSTNDVSVEIHFQPFELNPHMAAQGQDITEHLMEKYGSTAAQIAQARDGIRARGAELGFAFNMDKRARIYNTFDAHRLLHWADLEGKQLVLKQALFAAYFCDGKDPSDRAVLVGVAASVGLDAQRAGEILATGEYADAVRAQESYYLRRGVQAVPAVIINDQHLIQGGQPARVFEQALRQIAAAT